MIPCKNGSYRPNSFFAAGVKDTPIVVRSNNEKPNSSSNFYIEMLNACGETCSVLLAAFIDLCLLISTKKSN